MFTEQYKTILEFSNIPSAPNAYPLLYCEKIFFNTSIIHMSEPFVSMLVTDDEYTLVAGANDISNITKNQPIQAKYFKRIKVGKNRQAGQEYDFLRVAQKLVLYEIGNEQDKLIVEYEGKEETNFENSNLNLTYYIFRILTHKHISINNYLTKDNLLKIYNENSLVKLYFVIINNIAITPPYNESQIELYYYTALEPKLKIDKANIKDNDFAGVKLISKLETKQYFELRFYVTDLELAQFEIYAKSSFKYANINGELFNYGTNLFINGTQYKAIQPIDYEVADKKELFEINELNVKFYFSKVISTLA